MQTLLRRNWGHVTPAEKGLRILDTGHEKALRTRDLGYE